MCPQPCAKAPVKVTGVMGVLSVSLGQNHTCVVLTGGGVACWGENFRGQLGNGTTSGPLTSMGGAPCNATPTMVAGLTDVTAVSCGAAYSCALHADTTMSCWGANYAGQLGDGSTNDSASPVAVAGLTGVTAMLAAESHTCALLTGGTVKCWGIGGNGRLGTGTMDNSLVPVPVAGLTGVKAISAGHGTQADSTCALLGDGTVWCWGLNQGAQLGSGTMTTTATPVQVKGVANATAISEGTNGGCALLADATIACWGNTGQNKQPAMAALVTQ